MGLEKKFQKQKYLSTPDRSARAHAPLACLNDLVTKWDEDNKLLRLELSSIRKIRDITFQDNVEN